jgi:anti-sigma factor RsiW
VNCLYVSHLLSAYADGELTGIQMLTIRRHVDQCDDCRKELDEVLRVKRVLCSLTESSVPEGLEERLRAKVFSGRKPKRLVFRAAGYMALSAAAATMAAFLVMQHFTEKPDQLAQAPAQPFDVQSDQAYAMSSGPFGPSGPVVPASYQPVRKR